MERIQGNKIHFTSLGCARNLVDTEVMIGILLKAGYEATAKSEEADFLVVNTCGFLASSRDESCNTIDQLIAEKKPGAKLIVAGCMVQKHKQELTSRFSDIHYYLGSGDVEKILEAIETPEAGEAVTTARSYLQSGEVPRQVSTPKHYAYLKIAEGCAKQCAFCIIPKIKGPLKSKAIEQVVKEFNILLDQGAQEIILIAQDLGDFGKDTKEKKNLEFLLEELCKIERPFWLRLLYLYPDEITDELIAIIKKDSRICRYLDMPMQHINNDILKSMKRKTSKEQIIYTINKLREEIPDIVIRTSLMVGFPGETEEQFQELMDFVKEYALDNIGIFTYSMEKESASAGYLDHIADDVKDRRYQMLAKLQLETLRKKNKKWLCKKLPVIVEGYHPESRFLMRGRHYGQCPEIDGQVIINDGRKVTSFGQIYEVEITEVADYDLIGKVVAPIEPSIKQEKKQTISKPLALV
ncbi:MAG: 30S ribosomal protein S12 methylthiotransferase RimO [Verrucomicrobia bacterium]|nr:30S ribosomal protein S12 methylthiotransferase RimO [Verrucomicrobiota bacterium]